MTRETLSEPCVTVTCDECGYHLGDEDGGLWHLHPGEDPEEWAVIDGRDICPECHRQLVCAGLGHAWSDWRPGFDGKIRVCVACDSEEDRPAGLPRLTILDGDHR